LEAGTEYFELNASSGELEAKKVHLPAVLIPVEDAKEEICGIQRIFLDPLTARKPVNSFKPSNTKHKFSKGDLKYRLGSVAGPVIQATGRSEFEDDLGSGDFVSGYSYHMSVHALGCLIIQCRPNSKANGLAMLKHLFPLFEYRS
jgi:hypothetical protein